MTLSNGKTYFIYLRNVVTSDTVPHSKRMLNLENATDEPMLSPHRLIARQRKKQLSLN